MYISLGQFNLILDQLKHEWPGNKYHLLRRNCNHFSKALLAALGLKAPSFINRLASAGDMLATVVPSFMLPKQINMLIVNGRPDMSSPEDDELDGQQQAEGKDGMLRSIPPGRSGGGAGVPTLSSGMTAGGGGGGGGGGGDWRQIAPQPSPDSMDDESFEEFLRASEKEYQREQEYKKLRAETQIAADQHAAAQLAKQHHARTERDRREHGHAQAHAQAHAQTQHGHQQSPQQHHRHHRSQSGSGSHFGPNHGSGSGGGGSGNHASSHGSGHGSSPSKPLSATETDALVDAAMAKFDLPDDVSESEKAQIRAVLRISIAAGAQS